MKKTVGKLVMSAFAAMLMAAVAATSLAQTASSEGEYCTEGHFAILMVETMKLNVRQTWDEEKAIESLTNLGIEPLDGWDAKATLTEGTEVFLLRFIDIPIYTENPEREVTLLEARSIVKKYERLFVINIAAFIMGDGTTATVVDERTMEHPSP